MFEITLFKPKFRWKIKSTSNDRHKYTYESGKAIVEMKVEFKSSGLVTLSLHFSDKTCWKEFKNRLEKNGIRTSDGYPTSYLSSGVAVQWENNNEICNSIRMGIPTSLEQIKEIVSITHSTYPFSKKMQKSLNQVGLFEEQVTAENDKQDCENQPLLPTQFSGN
jgi:hypothetical protein